MTLTDPSRLILGGHSFIEALGNDPEASFEEQCAIVSRCLDAGVRRMDTTYYQERVALGKVLQHLGRREEAYIQAWNFFCQPGRENELVPWTSYAPEHLPVMLAELQTDYIDLLVIHVHDDSDRLREELALAGSWQAEGKVREIGLGMVQQKHLAMLPSDHSVTQVLAPYNAFNREAAEVFAAARTMGLRTIAMSPFVRGWKMDEIIAKGETRELVADLLLRWVITQPLADGVIVSMRRAEWVTANVQSLSRGPLSPEEQGRLDRWLSE